MTRAALAALALVALAGCASSSSQPKPIEQQQMTQANLQADLSALKSRNQELRMRLEDIEAVLGRKERGFTLDDVNRRLAQLEQAVARMAATLGVDYKPEPAPDSAAYAQAAPAAPAVPSGPASPGYAPYQPPGAPQATAPAAPAAPAATGGNDPAEAIYSMGMEAYNRREYDKASTLFSELIKSYPASSQAPSALFWQAEANYQQGDYGRAALISQDLIQKYPSHPLVPSAMLKQAQSFRRLGKGPAAKILLQDVAKRYPGTPEARAAAAMLKEMR